MVREIERVLGMQIERREMEISTTPALCPARLVQPGLVEEKQFESFE